MNQKLFNAVVKQITFDLISGDLRPIEKLLSKLDKRDLFLFLSEDDTVASEDDINSLLLKYGQTCNVSHSIVPKTHTLIMWDGVEYLLPKDTSEMSEGEIETLEIINYLFWS
jgi:hypothetical protein